MPHSGQCSTPDCPPPPAPVLSEDVKMEVNDETPAVLVPAPVQESDKEESDKPKERHLKQRREWIWTKHRGWFEGCIHYRTDAERRQYGRLTLSVTEKNRPGRKQRIRKANAIKSAKDRRVGKSWTKNMKKDQVGRSDESGRRYRKWRVCCLGSVFSWIHSMRHGFFNGPSVKATVWTFGPLSVWQHFSIHMIIFGCGEMTCVVVELCPGKCAEVITIAILSDLSDPFCAHCANSRWYHTGCHCDCFFFRDLLGIEFRFHLY